MIKNIKRHPDLWMIPFIFMFFAIIFGFLIFLESCYQPDVTKTKNYFFVEERSCKSGVYI